MNAYHIAVAAEQCCPPRPNQLCASREVMAAYRDAHQRAHNAWRAAAWMAMQRALGGSCVQVRPWLQAVFSGCTDQASGQLDMERMYEQCMKRTCIAECKAIVKELVRMGAVVIKPPTVELGVVMHDRPSRMKRVQLTGTDMQLVNVRSVEPLEIRPSQHEKLIELGACHLPKASQP